MYNYCHVSIIIDLMEISYPRSSGLPIVKIRSSRGRADRARPRVINTTEFREWVDWIAGRWYRMKEQGAITKRRGSANGRMAEREPSSSFNALLVSFLSFQGHVGWFARLDRGTWRGMIYGQWIEDDNQG